MSSKVLREFHGSLGAVFAEVHGEAWVAHYGDPLAEYRALTAFAGVADLSGRGRLCLTGADRQAFLNGQVTADVQALASGQGCRAALVNAKGRIQADLQVWRLPEEILIDFDPGYAATVARRLEAYLIAEDVQVIDVSGDYGLVSVLGPMAHAVIARLGGPAAPTHPGSIVGHSHPVFGEMYVGQTSRSGAVALDVFAPVNALPELAERLREWVGSAGGRWVGWDALETARIEAGVPRFGVDMDESNLAPETGIERDAISYRKGCYVGQEVIARIRTYGQVAKALRGLELPEVLPRLPRSGDKLEADGQEVGSVTSAVFSPRCGRAVAMGYVRREHNASGRTLRLLLDGVAVGVKVVDLPAREIRT